MRSYFVRLTSARVRMFSIHVAALLAPALGFGAPPPAQPAPTVAPRIDAVAIATAELPPGVKRSAQLDAVIADLKRGAVDQANTRWRDFVGTLSSSGSVDPNALVQYVLRESYLQTTEDLRFLADKVKDFNDCKKAIREYLTELRAEAQSLQPWPRKLRFVTFRTADVPGQTCAVESGTRSFEKADLDRYIEELEQKLNAIGDDAQLANVDLQNALQEQQQTLQMMSNISKMLHDTVTSVIRQIRN
jgi:hypothetical protein